MLAYCHYTTPRNHFVRVGMPRIELGLHEPESCVLPVYYIPFIRCNDSKTTMESQNPVHNQKSKMKNQKGLVKQVERCALIPLCQRGNEGDFK